MDSFVRFAETYRKSKLDADLAKLQTMDASWTNSKQNAGLGAGEDKVREEAAKRIQAIQRGKAQRKKQINASKRRNLQMQMGELNQPHRGAGRYMGHAAVGSSSLR